MFQRWNDVLLDVHNRSAYERKEKPFFTIRLLVGNVLGPNTIIFAFCSTIQVMLHNARICCAINTEEQGLITDTAALKHTH